MRFSIPEESRLPLFTLFCLQCQASPFVRGAAVLCSRQLWLRCPRGIEAIGAWQTSRSLVDRVRESITSVARCSKKTDLISSIITYVILSGYSPFRSEDPADLIEETAQARINFHARYWNNVSAAAKDFILMLLNPDPAQRPTAAEALKHPVCHQSLFGEFVWLTSA